MSVNAIGYDHRGVGGGQADVGHLFITTLWKLTANTLEQHVLEKYLN